MIFVDTNILVNVRFVYADNHDIAHHRLQHAIKQDEIAISRQIMREYLAVVTRKEQWLYALSIEEAWRDVIFLTTQFHVLEDNDSVFNVLGKLCTHVPVASNRVHDANIVATMVFHGVRQILTLNESDFRPYKNKGYVDFFATPA